MEKTNSYIAPQVEIIEVAVEKGYALSYTDDPADPNYGVGWCDGFSFRTTWLGTDGIEGMEWFMMNIPRNPCNPCPIYLYSCHKPIANSEICFIFAE